MYAKMAVRAAIVGSCALMSAGCLPWGAGMDISAALKPVPAEAQVLLAKNGMTQDAPIFVRIFKEESQLEIWKQKADGRFHHFKTYPICTWSGELGPKLREGDKQSPEGFYRVTAGQMNPNSQFHLAFNLGYPNAFDRAHGRTGSALMVHGKCASAGCYAMTDALIEEIYALAREAFRGGQRDFHVHAFPFRMTDENMKRHSKNRWYSFWKTLKPGYDDFERTRMTPEIYVCSKQYLVNAQFLDSNASPNPSENCPAYRRVPGTPFSPVPQVIEASASPAAVASSRVAAYDADPANSASGPQYTDSLGGQEKNEASSAPATAAMTPAVQESPSATSEGGESESVADSDPVASDPSVTESSLHNVVQSGKSDMILPRAQAQ